MPHLIIQRLRAYESYDQQSAQKANENLKDL